MVNWTMRGRPSDIWALGVVMLWVLRYIPLPDKSWEPWRVSAIHSNIPGSNSHHAALHSMSQWIDYIKRARLSLRGDDRLEAIVYQTLETDIRVRISAEGLCQQLGIL